MGSSRDISEEANSKSEWGGEVGNSSGKPEDTQLGEAAPTVSQYPTTDQMLRSQAMEYATRESGSGDVMTKAQEYYNFLKGSTE